MTNPAIVLAACMAPLGGVDMSTFSGRLALQKHVYLMQLFGIDLGYRFSWYLHGPYSPALAERGFEVEERKETINQLLENVTLEEWVQDRLRKYQELVNAKPDGTPMDLWLEVLASLHYLKHIMPGQPTEKRDQAYVISDLLQRKPSLKKHYAIITCAWTALEGFGLTEHKTIR